MFNIFNLSDDDRNQMKKNVIENACLTLISTGNYNVRWKACWICDYDFFFMSKYVMLYIKPLQKKKYYNHYTLSSKEEIHVSEFCMSLRKY